MELERPPAHCLACGRCNDPREQPAGKSIVYDYQCECGAYYGVLKMDGGAIMTFHHTAEEMRMLSDAFAKLSSHAVPLELDAEPREDIRWVDIPIRTERIKSPASATARSIEDAVTLSSPLIATTVLKEAVGGGLTLLVIPKSDDALPDVVPLWGAATRASPATAFVRDVQIVPAAACRACGHGPTMCCEHKVRAACPGCRWCS